LEGLDRGNFDERVTQLRRVMQRRHDCAMPAVGDDEHRLSHDFAAELRQNALDVFIQSAEPTRQYATRTRMTNPPPTRPSLLLRLRDVEDADAWREFVRLYTPMVFGHCTRHGLQEADAADVAQEVMRVAMQAMPEFEYDAQRGKFRGWLLQTTRHRLYKFFARERRAPQPASETTIERFFDQEPGTDERARWEEEYRQRLFDWAAEKARPEFQPATWQAFWLTAVKLVSVKEVAGQVGISVGAVYIARSRVVARLRELIETTTDEPIEILERRNARTLPNT
jgi:RNA polymerase sigma factor (sigma-70 family)